MHREISCDALVGIAGKDMKDEQPARSGPKKSLASCEVQFAGIAACCSEGPHFPVDTKSFA